MTKFIGNKYGDYANTQTPGLKDGVYNMFDQNHMKVHGGWTAEGDVTVSGSSILAASFPYPVTSTSTMEVTGANMNVTFKVSGRNLNANGAYVQGTVLVSAGTTLTLYVSTVYCGVFYGPSGGPGAAPLCIMVGAEGGSTGRRQAGAAGYPTGGAGQGLNNSGGGQGGSVSGYLSGSGGSGGPRGGNPGLPANPGNPGGLFSYGNGGNGTDGGGGRGGFGYYGGGGGGGGWDYDFQQGNTFGGGGGGGAAYAHGLPPASPAPGPYPVSNVTTGGNSGAAYLQIISVAAA